MVLLQISVARPAPPWPVDKKRESPRCEDTPAPDAHRVTPHGDAGSRQVSQRKMYFAGNFAGISGYRIVVRYDVEVPPPHWVWVMCMSEV